MAAPRFPLSPAPSAVRLRAAGWGSAPTCSVCGGSALGHLGAVRVPGRARPGSRPAVACVPCALAAGLPVPPAALAPPAGGGAP